MPALLIKASSFGFNEMARVFKARINSYLNGPCSVKEVAGLKKQAEIYPGKCRSEGRTSHAKLQPFFQLEYGSFYIFFPVIVMFVIYQATTVD